MKTETIQQTGDGNCVFCKILAGELPVSMVYEDDRIAVFPPLQPVNKGHLLIIPKVHAPHFKDLHGETAGYIMKFAQQLSAAIRKSSYKCEGINLFLADGEAAQQEVFHFHLHVYPRFSGDGFGFKYDTAKHFVHMQRPELDEIAKEIRKHLE